MPTSLEIKPDAIGAPLLHHYGDACAHKASRKLKSFQRKEDSARDSLLPHRVHIALRPFQQPIFADRSTGILILHWSRQIGKSFALAAWAVDRLLTRPGRLVTVLSNSRDNGAEFVAKCAEVCRLNGTEYKSVDRSRGLRFQNMRMEVRIRAEGQIGRIKVLAANPRTARGFSGDLILDEFAFHEDSQAIWEAAEPILAGNPDFLCRIASTGNGRHNLFYRMTAHVPETTMWLPCSGVSVSAAEPQPIVPAQTQPLVAGPRKSPAEISDALPIPARVTTFGSAPASFPGTAPWCPSGRTPGAVVGAPADHFPSPPTSLPSLPSVRKFPFSAETVSPGGCPQGLTGILVGTGIANSAAGFAVSRIPRSLAFSMGVKIYDPNTRAPITPDHARSQALDKRAYDQNYECSFADENATLLSHELINAAERDFRDGQPLGFVCEQDWSGESLTHLAASSGPLYVGFDVGRKLDLSVITVMEDLAGLHIVRAILRMQNLRLPDQQQRLGEICRLPKFRRAAIDMTGLGLGLFEYAQEEFGAGRIVGINFASTVPATRAILREGRKRETVRVTESMAMELLQTYEDRRILHPADSRLRDDLRKPEKITTPGGRVSIAATRDEAGHADHFWSFALALEASSRGSGQFHYQSIPRPPRTVLL